MDIFDPHLVAFTIALIVVGVIALLEILGLMFGVAFSGLIDNLLPDFGLDTDFNLDADLDSDIAPDASGFGANTIEKALSWLGLGKVPVVILFATFLGAFGLSGLLLQNAVVGLIGGYLPGLLAAPMAFIAAFPATSIIARAVAKVIPKETTDAVSTDTFIGRTALIIRGEAREGAPAEAKLTDGKGATQYILVAPDQKDAVFPQGSEVLLVERSGAVFKAIANDNPTLSNV